MGAFIYPFSQFRLHISVGKEAGAMAKPIAVCALCIISAAIGAGVDHYLGTMIEQGLVSGAHMERAISPKAAVAGSAEMNGAEVLRDRVKCDVRYQELKIPPDEYQSFKLKCMGENYSDND